MVAGCRECVVLDALTEVAGQPFSWSVACLDEGIGQEFLREIFTADQQRLQAGKPTPLTWYVSRQQPRRHRQRRICSSAGGGAESSLHTEAQEQVVHCHLPKHGSCTTNLPLLTLREASSSSASTSCSYGSCDAGHRDNQPHTCSDHGSSRSSLIKTCAVASLDCQHGLVHAPPDTQLQDGQAHSHASSLRPPTSTPYTVEDVTAQKMAAQERFAQQQQQDATRDTGPAGVDATILQQEQARLMRQDLPLQMLGLLLLCSALCCTIAAAAKVHWNGFADANPWGWPVLLLLAGSVSWLFMGKLRPLQFKHAVLEQQYVARHQAGCRVLDCWFSLAGCGGILAGTRSQLTGPAAATPLQQQPSDVAAGAVQASAAPQAALLAAVLLSLVVVMSLAARVYCKWREQLLFAGKMAIVSGLVALNHPGLISSSADGVLADPQPSWWLALCSQRSHTPTGLLLAMCAAQACLHLVLMVRMSGYLPMQMFHVVALLLLQVPHAGCGMRMAVSTLQVLACALWVPAAVLAHLEVSARRLFLEQCHAHAAGCSVSSTKAKVLVV